jgi:hypothetical protein
VGKGRTPGIVAIDGETVGLIGVGVALVASPGAIGGVAKIGEGLPGIDPVVGVRVQAVSAIDPIPINNLKYFTIT